MNCCCCSSQFKGTSSHDSFSGASITKAHPLKRTHQLSKHIFVTHNPMMIHGSTIARNEETPFRGFRGDKGSDVWDDDEDTDSEKCDKSKSVEVGEAMELPQPQLWQNNQLFDLETRLKSLLVFLLHVISFEEFW
ncbi:hypothetical protein SESBI_18385 [Sesbania bispinosa]|nr:hypothetical protein SESBI_18385 [Sesbania bispinosa]